MGLKAKILAFLSSDEPKEEVITLAEEKLENGTVLVSDAFEAGNQVFIKGATPEDENVALPVGEYDLEGGKKLSVKIEGEIESIGEPAQEEEEASEEPKEEELTEDVKEEEKEEKTEMEEVVVDENHMAEMHTAILDLTARLEALEAPKQEELTEEVKEEVKVELSSEEDPKPDTHSPEKNVEKKVRFYFPSQQ
tara:strand:+ start:822 stop:1403 length:582 start_codon:yes stop_codon:yes gene_type:complete